MEVPRLGGKLELPPPDYTATTATQDLSRVCDLQRWILKPLSEAGFQTSILMVPRQVCYHWTTKGAPFTAMFLTVVLLKLKKILLKPVSYTEPPPASGIVPFLRKIIFNSLDWLSVLDISWLKTYPKSEEKKTLENLGSFQVLVGKERLLLVVGIGDRRKIFTSREPNLVY